MHSIVTSKKLIPLIPLHVDSCEVVRRII